MLNSNRDHHSNDGVPASWGLNQKPPGSGLSSDDELIAIVGIGCRLPGGVNDAESYWRLLESGTDAISETPADRWSLEKFYRPNTVRPGKTQSKWGGYVSDIDLFDPLLFGISPREAAGMDPQQRMLLEVAWRAIEDAGQGVEQIAGQAVSVFVGISSFDYAVANLSHQDRSVIDTYSNTGGSSSIAANRISYCFDLRGPSVAVDTACSSSLVAVHAACESIWRGDCPMALAGGVNALLMPDFYVAFSQLGVLSPDGRCKAFDARANGYVRSEGAGMVLLKPLRSALHDQDRIYAVVRATALNQDGRTPGLTVPSQAAQESLLRTACRRAGIRPADIQYVEAHGTGTPVGDPIEANALGKVLSEGRDPKRPCLIGSVKTNIGHLEAGAGIASLIKVALALHHRRIPPHLHLECPNPAIDFNKLQLSVPTQSQQWLSDGRLRTAGINGFGYGGANAHVILQEAPANNLTIPIPSTRSAWQSLRFATGNSRSKAFQPPILIPISAHSKQALPVVASDMSQWLERAGTNFRLDEIAAFAALRRSHQAHREAVVGGDFVEIIEQLQSLSQDVTDRDSVHDLTAEQLAKGCVFVCSGQGPQWWAMGRQLLHHSPVFRQVIEQCDKEFSRYGDWSLVKELERDQAFSRMQKTSIAQPSIFALQVALAGVWRSWGIEPTALVGHSVGEIAAAHLSGALDWEDACRVAFYRGQTMDLASSRGSMLAVGLPAIELPLWLDDFGSDVSLTAINGPTSLTVSGAPPAIERLADRLEKAGVFCKRLAVEYAFHSPQMEPVREGLLAALKDIRPRATHTPLVSTVSGRSIDGQQLDAQYWWTNVREPVRFEEAIHELANQGFRIAVEIGPHPVLAYSINECFQAGKMPVISFASLHREQDDFTSMLRSLGGLYSLGFDVCWPNLYAKPRQAIPLPKYPFQRQRLWSESNQSRQSRTEDFVHPLLGESQHGPVPRWHGRIELRGQRYLEDHRVRGACVFPAAAIMEIAIAAARQTQQTDAVELNRIQLITPCLLDNSRPQWIETSFRSDRRVIDIACRESDGDHWTQLATIGVTAVAESPQPACESIEAVRSRCTEVFDQHRCYDYCKSLGLEYGPRFRGVLGGQRRDGEALVEVELDLSSDCEFELYCIHPALLDSCFHSMIVADKDFDHTLSGLYLPIEIRQLRFLKMPTSRLTVHTRLISKTRRRMVADIDVFNSDGQPCLSVLGFESQRVNSAKTSETVEDLVYSYQWVRKDLTDAIRTSSSPVENIQIRGTEGQKTEGRSDGETEHGYCSRSSIAAVHSRWLVFADDRQVGKHLIERLQRAGQSVVEVRRGGEFKMLSPSSFTVHPENRQSFQSLLERLEIAPKASLTKIVYLWGLDAPDSADLTAQRLEKSTVLTTLAPLLLVQAWSQINASVSADFTIVTAGAQPNAATSESLAVAQSPLIGFGRVIISEFDRFRTKLVDLPADIDDDEIANLLDEIISIDEEDEVQWRSGQRFVHRFQPQADQPVPTDSAQTQPFQLQGGPSAAVEELHYRTKPKTSLRPNEVEIEVLATGLNFSDVMKSLDLYPGLVESSTSLGAECSGKIVRTGVNVNHWHIGDEVIAIAPGAFASHVTLDAALVARKPNNLSLEQAASIPIAFLTAQYALHDCARIREGESVLIHSASGGVGLAAIQLARLAGAKVFATAGNDEKRDYVRKLGVEHVMDSRSLSFADETLRVTAGVGVDVVLNSLPGDAIAKGISLLKTGGRFLEIGKRDINNDSALGLYPFRNNLSLFAIDLDQLFREQPQRMGDMLRNLVAQFEEDRLQPLPVTPFDAQDATAAFRLMQQGKHIGKIAVRFSNRPAEILPGSYAPIAFSPHATYWIAGGLGGFGMEIARWLVSHGARHLVLSGRSKSTNPHAKILLDELASCGAQVTAFPADITSPDHVRFALTWMDANLPPLRGVFHTAMILEDRLLVDLDRATLDRVLRPKVLGGWNLHEQTKNLPLDHFVLFSSLSSVFGHAGQANYAAANALLDALAHYRRSQNLPALVINWGHLGEVGYLAQRQQLGQRLQRQGVLSFTVRQATDCLEYAMQTQALQLSVLRMDWSIWQGLSTSDRVSPRFAHLLKNRGNNSNSGGQLLASPDQLRSASHAERLSLVDGLLRSKAASLLGIPSESIDSDVALIELGLDSLMAVELRNWIENRIQIDLPISALMRGASLGKITATICDGLNELLPPSTETPLKGDSLNTQAVPITSEQANSLLHNLTSLGDQQVTDLLTQLLRENGSVS